MNDILNNEWKSKTEKYYINNVKKLYLLVFPGKPWYVPFSNKMIILTFM